MARSHPKPLTPDLAEDNASVSSDGRLRDWKLSTLNPTPPYHVLVASTLKQKKKRKGNEGKSRAADKGCNASPLNLPLLSHAAKLDTISPFPYAIADS